jgi:hypothetical protein
MFWVRNYKIRINTYNVLLYTSAFDVIYSFDCVTICLFLVILVCFYFVWRWTDEVTNGIFLLVM